MHRQKAQDQVLQSSLESSIDKSPYVNIMEDGMVAPVINDGTINGGSPSNHTVDEVELSDVVGVKQQNEVCTENHNEHASGVDSKSPAGSANQQGEDLYGNKLHEIIAPVKRSINQLTQYQGRSVWLLAYIAFVTSWPLLGSLAFITFRKKFRNPLRAK
uniref:Embryogenesis-associated protein EMB8 n=1 Tax=Arundo donax TaxID=35708 RepID=A0A0A9E7A4_ARUDO